MEYSLDDVGDGNKLWSFLPVGEAVGKHWSFFPVGEAVGTGEGHGHNRYSDSFLEMSEEIKLEL